MSMTQLEIYNAALSLVGSKARVTAVDENSRAAEECGIWYSQVRSQVLSAARWPAAKRTARLTLHSTRDFGVNWAAGNPEPQFLYNYEIPSDYLRAWYLVDYTPFELSWDSADSVRRINTNTKDAVMVYAHDAAANEHWEPELTSTVVHALAAHICLPLTQQSSRQVNLIQLANQKIMAARAAMANSETIQQEVLPPPLQARGFQDYTSTAYFYPLGSLFEAAVPNA